MMREMQEEFGDLFNICSDKLVKEMQLKINQLLDGPEVDKKLVDETSVQI